MLSPRSRRNQPQSNNPSSSEDEGTCKTENQTKTGSLVMLEHLEVEMCPAATAATALST